MMTVGLVTESKNVIYLSAVKYATWLVLSSTYHFLTDDSLQSAVKDQQESRPVTGKPHARCRCEIDA